MTLWLALASWSHAEEITLKADDGTALKAERWGKGAKGVVLVHDEARSRMDWALVAPKLTEAGCHVVAVDLRGHGKSIKAEPLTDADYALMVQDVGAAVGWLQKNGATEVHLVGARLGANLSLQLASTSTAVTDVALLSPSLNVRGLRLSAVAAGLGDRPVLAAASNEDVTAVKAAEWVMGAATGTKHLTILTNAGSGARMLNGAPELAPLLVQWLNGTLVTTPSAADAALNAPKTGMDAIETTGTRLEERNR